MVVTVQDIDDVEKVQKIKTGIKRQVPKNDGEITWCIMGITPIYISRYSVQSR